MKVYAEKNYNFHLIFYFYFYIIKTKGVDSNMISTEEEKAAKRAYFKEWRKKNPDKVLAAQQRYWQKKFFKMQKSETETKKEG